jgi:aminopeptidase N
MTRSGRWLGIVAATALAAVAFALVMVGLAACGPLSSTNGQELAASGDPAPGLASLGMEGLGPLPEYHLTLALDLPDQRVEGRQQVTVPNRTGDDLEEIVFRLYPNLPQYGGNVAIGPVWVDGQRGTSSLRAADTSLVIPLAQPLPPEASVTISLTFGIDIPRRDKGYVLFGESQGVWSLPDAYPLLAVHDSSAVRSSSGSAWYEDLAPPHGDAVFAEAATYEVSLTLPPTLTLVTTGSVVDEHVDKKGQRVYHIVGGPLREFAWLASADYIVDETTASGTVVRSYYLPGDEAAGQSALHTAAAALRVYSNAYGAYPFAEMTVAEAPLGHFGMEYPGLSLIGIDLYRDRREGLEDRLAHEIAHQWWYSQVGNDQVNTPWLDEGLAEYSTATYYRDVYGQARANTLINQRWLVPYQAAVEEGYDTVVNQPSAAFGPEYEVIVYGKAALFFDALRQRLGDDVYQAVISEYLDLHRWRIATPDDLLRVIASVSGQDVESLYNHWILGKQ